MHFAHCQVEWLVIVLLAALQFVLWPLSTTQSAATQLALLIALIDKQQ